MRRGEYVASDFSEFILTPSFIAMTSSDNLQWNRQGFIKIFVATDKVHKESCLVGYKLWHFQFSFGSKLKYNAFLMNVSKAWATHQIVATEPESDSLIATMTLNTHPTQASRGHPWATVAW
jgi:hypothetical protein